MRALIIEDEFNCSEVLHAMLTKHVPSIKTFKIAENVSSGVAQISEFTPDIVFLDIQLGEETCFELLDQLKEINFHIIFTTAYDHYAIKAFEYAAMHYLLKPVILSDLKEAVKRCLDQKIKFKKKSLEKVKSLYLKTSLKDYNIVLDQILFIKADGSYSTVNTEDGKSIFTSKKLVDYERLLPETFYRVHHSIIINLKWVELLNKSNNTVLLTTGTELPISRRKKTDFKRALLALKPEI